MDIISRNLLDALTLFESLENALLVQHGHLLKRDMVAVEDDARQLRLYLDRIRHNILLRSQKLANAGFSPDEHGMVAYLDTLETRQSQARQQWQQLEQLVVRCREINSMNGRLQGRLRSVTSRLMVMIWGQVPGRAYNRFGQITGGAFGSNRQFTVLDSPLSDSSAD